jgi:hypothetical protein
MKASWSKKRGNGEGSITKRKEVADKLAKMLSDRVEGIVYDENMTVGE